MTKFEILYEDNHLLIVVKPVNIAVQADDSHDPDLLTLLKQDLKDRYQKPGNVYLGLVHRLDRPVGGVMVFAKTSKAASRLSDQVRTRSLKKTYQAVLCGQPQKSAATLKDWLIKDEKTNRVRTVPPASPKAKEAILHYQILGESEGLSLVQIQLETGRSHQIRVQFASRQLSLWGDQRYNPKARPGQQIALWATSLTLQHPITHESMTFACSLPNSYPWNLFSHSNQKGD